jgi:hypothetical protein
MALFSRRGKNSPASDPDVTSEAAEVIESETVDGSAAVEEAVPQVGISVSTYGQPRPAAPPVVPAGATRMKRGPAEAPAPTQSLPGLPDNTLVRAALESFPEKPQPADFIGLMRQLMQGNLYVRVRGDARAQLAEGTPITMAVSAIGDDRYLLAFTGGDALRASVQSDGDAQTSALGQPVQAVLRNVVSGPYAGMILDHATEGKRAILPRALVEKALDEADPALTIKNLLAAPRTPETASAVAAALAGARLWVAANQVSPDDDRVGVAEARRADGTRLLEIFTHPLEIATLGRNDRALPLTAEQLGRSLASDAGLAGVLIDPAGPWIELDRDALAPLLTAAAEGSAGERAASEGVPASGAASEGSVADADD